MKGIFLFLLLISVWLLCAELQLVSSLYLPHPQSVLESIVSPAMLSGTLVSLVRTLSGFLLGLMLAYCTHYMGMRFGILEVLDPQFAASRAIPTVAVMPLFLLWFGFGEFGRIAIIAFTAFLFFLAPLNEAFRLLPTEWKMLRKSLSLADHQYYLKVVIPGTATTLLGAFRVTFAIAFTVAIASDYLGAERGLGKVVDTARITFNVPGIFGAIVTAAGVGLILDQAIVRTFRWSVHWAGLQSKR